MAERVWWVASDTLERFMADVFKGLGVPARDARVCADVLITADKRGIDSHGVSRLKTIYYDRIRRDGIQSPVTRFEVARDHRATAVVDGHHGMGMVVGKRCMEMAIRKARRYGLGMVVARNSTHYGIAAYYSLLAARAGMIGLSGTNARPSIAPTFGVENMLGTNPLVFAMPTDEAFPFTNDYATSITQRGKIERYAREGKVMPAGWVIDRSGRTRTDPRRARADLVADRVALTPLGGIGEDTGGYKGYGYATVVEILSAALQHGAFLKQLDGLDARGRKVPYRLGHFFMAVNIRFFTNPAAFKKTTGDILRRLRASRRAPGRKRIYTCGEKEYLASLERRNTGIPIAYETAREILTMRDELGLKQYRFPFDTKARAYVP
ncbi:MAG: Ldh family oxidoreductase [Verrucomicrobiota bacterium]|nr:Ldh family oxidoreductase [Verrucomicrobiota bacterium]